MVAPRSTLGHKSPWRRLLASMREERAQPEAPAQLEQPARLFIIGAARSGTTVLQSALNHSPDVFLFGEPVLDDPALPGFAERYNSMHKSWRNQETKSSYCPPVLKTDGTWPEYWTCLSRHFKWVGAKLVINPSDSPEDIEGLFAFQCRHFYQARYIFTFRRPLYVVSSMRGMQALVGDGVRSTTPTMTSYAASAALYLRALRNLPNVTAVFHEDAAGETLTRLGRWLDIRLDGAEAYYDGTRVQSYDNATLNDEERRRFGLLDDLYDAVKAASAEDGRRLQISQNNGHFQESHFTPVGSATRKAAMIERYFRQIADAEAAEAAG